MTRFRFTMLVAAVAVAAFPATLAVAWVRVLADGNTPSRVFGTVARGSIEHAHVIPPWGPGYVTYSFLGAALGRQYVDGRVRDTLLASFAARSRAEGGRRFVVGETGWPGGGRFRPHRSHQNGMAVDVFVPLRTRRGDAAEIGTWPWNTFGYGLEFDHRGERDDRRIDFEALAALLLEVDGQATRHGLRVGRVILAPEFVPLVLDTPSGRRLDRLGDRITRKPAWVRHDEHVHLDFERSGAAGVAR
ncbi:penicillin-insensitive murein endopeptidase [Anaeromyxobacter dehalogenans]|uniref:penicillin-insensitive murein endopeptidase n=1 Tax=Anaeromyxobacter dehalogenans TaxID=161493 RepID=UPI0003186386|nr:penicillin-insensitive murein endopeptidase [Anaeromyxobacter dehalogenans]